MADLTRRNRDPLANQNAGLDSFRNGKGKGVPAVSDGKTDVEKSLREKLQQPGRGTDLNDLTGTRLPMGPSGGKVVKGGP